MQDLTLGKILPNSDGTAEKHLSTKESLSMPTDLAKIEFIEQNDARDYAEMRFHSKILLVGRDPRITILRKQILEKEGYCVITTDNLPDDSLLHLQSVSFDAVILDYSIPQKQRKIVASNIRKHHPEIPILAIFRLPGEYDRTPTRCIHSLDGPEAMLEALKEVLGKIRPSSAFQPKSEQSGDAVSESVN